MRWPGGEKSIGSDVPADRVKRGFYLATLAHCMECHSHKPDGTPDFVNSWGKGGHEMKGAFGSVIASNILSHNEKGVGVWSDDELRRALIEGKGRDGRAFKQPMARHVYFSKMTDQDINAIILDADHSAGRIGSLVPRASSRYTAAHDDCFHRHFASPPPFREHGARLIWFVPPEKGPRHVFPLRRSAVVALIRWS